MLQSLMNMMNIRVMKNIFSHISFLFEFKRVLKLIYKTYKYKTYDALLSRKLWMEYQRLEFEQERIS